MRAQRAARREHGREIVDAESRRAVDSTGERLTPFECYPVGAIVRADALEKCVCAGVGGRDPDRVLLVGVQPVEVMDSSPFEQRT